MRLIAQIIVITAASISLSAAGLPAPPVAPVRPVTDEYFGHRITDPYRYMETLSDPEVQSWIKSQADYATSALDRIPGRQSLLARIHELTTSRSARVTALQLLPGGVFFYEKALASENVPKLYMRRGLGGQEITLLDPTKLNKTGGPSHAISYYFPSH